MTAIQLATERTASVVEAIALANDNDPTIAGLIQDARDHARLLAANLAHIERIRRDETHRRVRIFQQ